MTTSAIIIDINDPIAQLKFYKGPFKLTLRPGASETLIKTVEHAYGTSLPDDFKTLYRFSNGFEIDEDMLNMISLEEMISNKESDKPIWIAEYMIYCDEWELNIHPDNPNDYSISGYDGYCGRTILTNSLAEFIGRMLKGGVSEKGGLYHWRDEINAKTYGNTTTDDIKPLYAVFNECLKLDLMSEQDIIQWADWIISTEEGPDPYFIQIAASRNRDELLTALNSIDLPDDILHVRVIFGMMDLQFLIDKISAKKALKIIGNFADRKDFSPYEANEILYLVNKGKSPRNPLIKSAQLKLYERIKEFLGMYHEFNPYHCKNWDDVNSKLVEKFLGKN